MDWTELQIIIAVENIEEAAAIAHMTVPYGMYIEDYSDLEQRVQEIAHIDLIDEELLQKQRDKAILHLYINPQENPAEASSFLQQRYDEAGIAYKIQSSLVKEEEWATSWKKYYHPVHIGKRMVVCPSWEAYDAKKDEAVLILDPGMAFGTGTHETTRLCMELLEQSVNQDATLLDIGCGSGILAIMGILLGAKEAVGVDIDANAIQVAKENARLNGQEDHIHFLCGDLTEHVNGRFDLVCANIVADIILRLLDTVHNFMAEDSIFICSGIIDQREGEVVSALQQAGFEITAIRRDKGWSALACTQIAQ